MKAHGINNQQDVHQRRLINLIAADFEAQAKTLYLVTTPYVVSEKVSQTFRDQSLRALAKDPGEPGDEVIAPLAFTTSK